MLTTKTKKLTTVAMVGVATIALSSCAIKVDVGVEADGTGEFNIGYEFPKEFMAQSLGVPEDEVASALETQMAAEESDLPPSMTTEITEDEDSVSYTISAPFTYDTTGAYVEDTDGSQVSLTDEQTGINVVQSEDGSTATVTYSVDNSAAGGESMGMDGMMNFYVSATFPGEVQEATEGGVIEGNTVTWTMDSSNSDITEFKAVGSLGGGGGLDIMTIGLGVLVLLLLGAGGWFGYQKLSSKKNDGGGNGANQVPGAGYMNNPPNAPQYNQQPQQGYEQGYNGYQQPQQGYVQPQAPQQAPPTPQQGYVQPQAPQQAPTPQTPSRGLPQRPGGLPRRPGA